MRARRCARRFRRLLPKSSHAKHILLLGGFLGVDGVIKMHLSKILEEGDYAGWFDAIEAVVARLFQAAECIEQERVSELKNIQNWDSRIIAPNDANFEIIEEDACMPLEHQRDSEDIYWFINDAEIFR